MEVKPEQFDLAIVGAGPAGTAAAITAVRNGAKVALLEAGDFPRQKVCGEFVSAESLELLRGLLRDLPKAAQVLDGAPVLSQARLFLGGRVLRASVSPAALSIPRYALDQLLWEAAQQAGVWAHPKCEVLAIDGQGPFTISTTAGEIAARAVMLCAGRWSRFSDKCALPPGPKWMGVKAHYRERNPPQSTDLYFFDHGYCGVQPVGDDVVNACALVRSDYATSLDEVLCLSPQLADRAVKWQPVMQPVSTAPLLYRKPAALRGHILLAGDAAGFIDPFAGDGISIALRSGTAAAQQMHSLSTGHATLEEAALRYRAQYEREFAPRSHRLPRCADFCRSRVSRAL